MSARQSSKAPAPAIEPAGDPPEFRFFNEIGIIGQLSQNLFETVMPVGLSVAQFGVLNHFVRLGGRRNPVELARSFQVSKPAMTKLVAKLREKGLVTVEPDPTDGRGKLVSITKQGERMRNDAIAKLAPILAAFGKTGASRDIAKTIPVLEAVRIWLDENRHLARGTAKRL